MFTIDDLWKLITYLKQKDDGTIIDIDTGLSELTTTLALSEKLVSKTYFEEILDQSTFSSNDYKMLRKLLIDWYSSHKTIASTQRFASDVHQLPNNHLSELFKSFGFPLGLDLVPLTSKANFFLDLVNFYKKKGTPETLVDVLDYYGFSDSDLVEYWLLKDEYGSLVFRGEPVRQAASGSTLFTDTDVSFEKMTKYDPHWFQSKEQIETLTATNTINLPSKSPYFSLSSIFSLYKINTCLTILFRIVKDQYDRFLENKSLPKNIPIKNLGFVVPILHVFVASSYVFQRMFEKEDPNNSYIKSTSYLNCGCYRGTINYQGTPPIAKNLDDIITEYEQLIARPVSRQDMETRLEELQNGWTFPNEDNFLNILDVSGQLLKQLNPGLKDHIDSWFDVGDESYLITYLIGTLDNWIRTNIDTKAPSLVIIMLGLGFRNELDSIINFFKPYKARLAFMDTSFSIKNPLTESIILDEWLLTQVESSYRDAIRPPTFPIDFCLWGRAIEPPVVDPPPGYAGYYTHFRWDMGCFFDIPPLEQMDDEYYERLKRLIENSHTGTICDDVITEIDTFIPEILGEREVDGDIIPWFDKHEQKIITNIKESVIVNETMVTEIPSTIVDNFGLEPPQMYDVGSRYDSLQTKSIVRDSIHIDISHVGRTDSSTSAIGDLDKGHKTLWYTKPQILITETIGIEWLDPFGPEWAGPLGSSIYINKRPTSYVVGSLSVDNPLEP